MKGFYRFQLMVRSERIMPLTQTIREVTDKLRLPDDIRLAVDVDPVSLM